MEEKDTRPVMVSIKCLVYNHAPYLRDCLNGFVMQKTNFRFEAIVHDDASTDGSAAIIREYAEKYPDIIKPIYQVENQYSKRDGSLTRIMNKACVGKYIAYCEGDDYWIDSLKLQKQVDFLELNPDYSLCFHRVFEKLPDGTLVQDLFGHLCEKDYSAKEIYEKWSVATCSSVFRQDLLMLKPEDNRFVVGDLIQFLTCSLYGKMRCLNDTMGVYRRLSTGWVNQNLYSYQYVMNQISFREALEEHFPQYYDFIHPTTIYAYVRATLRSFKCFKIIGFLLLYKGISNFGKMYLKTLVRVIKEH